MFFDDFGGPQVTRTNFKATVSESEPYDFSLFTSQDVNTSVKLSQLVYTPPASVEEFNAYYEGKGQQPPAVEKGNVISVAAKIKGFTSNNKLETFTIAAFALDLARLQKSAEKKSSAKTPTDAILSDVAHHLKILLDIDGSVEFLVEGPGSVVFYGEQLTTLVSNGRPGDDSDSENQGSDMSEGELDEMFRLSRRMSDWDSNQDDLSFRRTLLGSDDWNFKEPSSRSSSSNHTPVVPSRQADCTIPFTESHAADVAIPQLPIPRGALLRRRQISDPPPRESQARYLSVGSDVNSSRSFTARSHATSSGVSPRPSSQSPRRYFPSPRSVVEARALPPEDLQKVFNSYISARLKDGLNTASVEQHRQILQQVLEHQYYSFHKSQDSVSASTQGTDAPMTEKSQQLDMIANTRFSERMTEQTVKRRIIAARFNWSNVLRYMDRPPLTIQFAVSPRVRRLCEQQTWAALIDHAVLNSHRYIMEDVQRAKWYDGCGQTRDSNDRMDGQAKLYPTNGVAVARRLPRDRRSGDRELACQRQSLLLNTLFREGLYAYHDYATNKWLSPFYGFSGKDDYGSAARAHVLALPNRTFMADSEDFVQSPRPVSPLALSETRWHQLTSKRSSLSNSFSLDSNSPITSSFAPVENDAERRQGGSPMTHQMPDPEIAVSNAVRPPSHFNTGLYPYIICEDNSGKVHLFLEEDSPPPTSYLLQWLCRRHACRLQTVDERTRRANNFFKTVDGDEEGSVFSYAYVNVPEQREKELRPIALHLTDTQLPWLASQLQLSGFAEGGLALTDLFLALDIQRVLHLPQLLSSWLWMKNVFNAQRNLFSFSVTIRESTMDAQQSRHMSAFQARQMRPMSAVSSHVSREVALGLRPHPYTLFDQMNFFPFLEMLHLCNETPIEVLEDILGPHHLERYPDVEGEVASPLDDDGQEEEEEEEENCFYLRELYFVGERKIRAKNGYPSRHSDDASLMGFRVTSKRLPCIEVLWLDVLRLRRLTFGAGHTFLRELHIVSDNAFKSSMLSGVGRLPVLEVFHVEKLSIDTLGYLGECPKLRELLVHNCRFLPITTNSNPLQDVEKISTLEYLSLAYSSEVKTIENFAKCLSLKKIVLTRCNGISSASIRGFENLPHLEMLCLEFTRVSHFSIFSKSNALRVLRLDSCKRVLRTSIEGLEMNNSLEEISLSGTNVATISNLGAGCARVHTLDLSLCRYLDVEGLQGVQALPSLCVLNLSYTNVTDLQFLQDCFRLEVLFVEGCSALRPDALLGLERARSLTRIVADNCHQLRKLGHLGKSPTLTSLSLKGIRQLTEECLEGMETSKSLVYLNLSETAVSSVAFFIGGLPRLQVLLLAHCPSLTTQGVKNVPLLPSLVDLCLRGKNQIKDINFLSASCSLQRVDIYDTLFCTQPQTFENVRRAGISVFF